jgi:cellulose synthase/poly-beta-1,6-N-acetylglucosamine synthase-like glycosyltransferase
VKIAFWGAAAAIAFTYVIAPIVIIVRGLLRPRPAQPAPIEPSVAVVIAARNEAARIGDRVDNLATLDYPPERLQVVIASDGSEDDTVAIARRRAADAPQLDVAVLDLGRVGKAEALNAAITRTTAEVVVFSDANTAFAPDAIRQIVAWFADPEVGGVAGNQVYLPRSATIDDSHGERGYWDVDRILKRAESAAGSTISATGALYALRRELVPTVIGGVTDDFYVSTAVVAAGRRLVFAPDAVALEPPAPGSRLEYRRKARIMTRGLRGVAARSSLLDPRRHGFYSFQLLWHKVLRRVMVIPLIVIAVSSLALAGAGLVYRLVAVAQVAGYLLAAAGLASPRSRLGRTRTAALAAFFVMVNAASLEAIWNLLTNRRIDRWEPRRDDGSATPTRGPVADAAAANDGDRSTDAATDEVA